MSDLAQAALISGGIFAVVMLTQFGRRANRTMSALRPIIMVVLVGYGYLAGAPTDATSVKVYLAAVGVGLIFAAGSVATTRVEVDRLSGKAYTVCGLGFVAVWLVAVAARLVFIWLVENNLWARNEFGTFMISHHVDFAVIAPFFVIWALTMVLARVVVVQLRIRHELLAAVAAAPAAVRQERVSVGS
ncbi:MAG: hypothetical protein ABIQ53_04825 [Terracoccus sp.]